MAATRVDVGIDCADVDAQARFWSAALGYERSGSWEQYLTLLAPAGVSGPKLVLQQVPEAKPQSKNRLHLDVIVGDDVDGEVERLIGLGARRLSDAFEEAGTRWVVMADPEGNEFCVCRS